MECTNITVDTLDIIIIIINIFIYCIIAYVTLKEFRGHSHVETGCPQT